MSLLQGGGRHLSAKKEPPFDVIFWGRVQEDNRFRGGLFQLPLRTLPYPLVKIPRYRVPLHKNTAVPCTCSSFYPVTAYPFTRLSGKPVPLLHFTVKPRTASSKYHPNPYLFFILPCYPVPLHEIIRKTSTSSLHYRDTAYRFMKIPPQHDTGLPRQSVNKLK